MAKSSHKPKKVVSTTHILELLHMELCAPMRTTSRGGSYNVFVIIDDFSGFTWVYFLKEKSHALIKFIELYK